MGLFSPQISTKRMVPLCRQLATAYGAGIPIVQTLDHVGKLTRDGKVRGVLLEMSQDLRNGATLAEAADKQRRYLPRFFINLMASGETGGHLDVMLNDLAQYYEDRLAMQRRIKGLMAYPVIQLVAAWFLGTFAIGLLGVVQGAFAGGPGGLNAIFAYVEVYLWFQAIAISIFIGLVLLAALLSRLGFTNWFGAFIATRVWPFSNVTRKFALARFFRSFALLLGSGLPITRCIEHSAAVTSNPYMERDLLRAVQPVKEGASLVEAFSYTRYLTPTAREMLLVGEESGNLEGQSKKIAQYHLEEATHAVQMATRVIGVMIVVAIAVLIGGIVIYFYASLYGGMLDELGI